MNKYICPFCGGKKSFQSRTCMKCRFLVPYERRAIGVSKATCELITPDNDWLNQFTGIFHSEGTATIHKTNKGTYIPKAIIKMRGDEEPMILDIQNKLGGHVRRIRRADHSPEIIWETGSLLLTQHVLKLIQVHTIIPMKKLNDVCLVLEFIEWRQNQPYHGADWSVAAQFKNRLVDIRVFKLPSTDG